MSSALVRVLPTLVASARELPVQPMADTLRDRRRYLNGQEKFELAGQAIGAASQMVTAYLATSTERQQTARHAAEMARAHREIERLDAESERNYRLAMATLHHSDVGVAGDAKALESGLALAELAMERGDIGAALAFYELALRGRAG